MIELLINNGAEIERLNPVSLFSCLWQFSEQACIQERFTALHIASSMGHYDAVKALINNDADVNAQSLVRYVFVLRSAEDHVLTCSILESIYTTP